MSIKDVIKKSILESDVYNQSISLSTIITIAIDLIAAIILGLVIYAVYKKFFKGVVYSRNFAITLVGMSVLSCTITLAISTNIVISLGMVGALSIVRFRTAIKEPLDLLYLFWAITSGITAGASMYLLAIIAAVVMIIVLATLGNEGGRTKAYIVVVNYEEDETGDLVLREMKGQKYSMRGKIVRDNKYEMTLYVKCKNQNTVFVEKINALEHVNAVSLLEFDGEYHA